MSEGPITVRTADGRKFSFPPLPSDPASYDYAVDNAFVSLPEACVTLNRIQANTMDRPSVRRYWVGRLFELPRGADLQCGCGWVIFLHGSGGFTYDNWRYVQMMTAAGYGVVVPDSMAGEALGLRYREPVQDLAETLGRQRGESGVFWCANNVYKTTCKPFNEGGPIACYSSTSRDILADPSGWARYYDRIHDLRRRELVRALERLPHAVRTTEKLFLAGASEGAVVASSVPLTGPAVPRIHGRIVLQWSCAHNYFAPRDHLVRICGDECAKSEPVLAMISERDPFFSAEEGASIAAQVAAATGHAGTLEGSCFATMADQGLEHAVAVILPEKDLPIHGLASLSPNFVRAAVTAFLQNPEDVEESQPLRNESGYCLPTRSSAAGALELRCMEIGGERARNATDECEYDKEVMHKVYYSMGPLERCASPYSRWAVVGFSWLDFGLGIAAGVALVVVLVGAAWVAARRRQRPRTTTTASPEASNQLVSAHGARSDASAADEDGRVLAMDVTGGETAGGGGHLSTPGSGAH